MVSLQLLPFCQWYILVVAGLVSLVNLCSKRRRNRPAFPLPPGLTAWTAINSWTVLPMSKSWETYNRWSQKYGSDIIRVTTLGHTFIILNSPESIAEFLEHRSDICSNRPRMVMFNEIIKFPTTVFTPYGPTWRSIRKIFRAQYNNVAVKKFQGYQTDAARELLSSLLTSPERFYHHCRRFASGIAINVAYGHKVSTDDDYLFTLLESIDERTADASRPGCLAVETFPFLQYLPTWFPGTKEWRDLAAELRDASHKARNVPFNNSKAEFAKGMARLSLVSESLKKLKPSDDEKGMNWLIRHAGIGTTGAGGFTTTATLRIFILIMMIYPECQRKAQEELDCVVGNHRLPRFEDQPELPYIEALLQEVLRWFPALPSSFPRVVSQDSVYKGNLVPKGSILIPNTWNVLHDPRTYPNPMQFIPDRFLPDENGHVAKDPGSNGVFGYGRRFCPGNHLARASLWIGMATILSTFNIKPPLGEDGKESQISFDFDALPRQTNFIPPFECRIEPRSEQVIGLIMEAAADSKS